MFDPTLFGLLSQIERDDIVLPAMQRPFVWKEDRIYKLIDSLLRGFPIGAIMLWRTSTVQRFRRMPRDIDPETPEVFNFETSTDSANKYLVLDGQQRLTSIFAAFKGTYAHKRLYIDTLSGNPEGKDPGNEYYDCQFLSETEALSLNEIANGARKHFVPIQELIKISPVHAATTAYKKAEQLTLTDKEKERIADIYIRCATILGSYKSLHVITVDEDPSMLTPVEEILEIFVRVNSGGLVLLKSDLLMSLLDLKWNDIQPELQKLVRDINAHRPFSFSRDDVLKSLLLAEGAETRFDRLVVDRKQVEALAQQLKVHMNDVKRAWELLGTILLDGCRIYSERFFRGGHNSLLPFVLFLSQHAQLSIQDRRNIVTGIYLSIMSGIFSGAEARMGSFARNDIAGATSFPLQGLVALIKREYGIKSLDDLLRRHLDLALNIAHGGITLDKNPDELQRDHIFPKSQLEKAGCSYDKINHYANFHFLRAKDNLNKLDRPPHEWFRNPGTDTPSYSTKDLDERLLTWDDLEPGNFDVMLERRGRKIREKTQQFFGLTEEQFNALFADGGEKLDAVDENADQKYDEKRRVIVDALSHRENVALINVGGVRFRSEDNAVRAVFPIMSLNKNDRYWYGYTPLHRDFLSESPAAFVVFGFSDRDCAYAVPASVISKILNSLSQTYDSVDKVRHWNIELAEKAGQLAIQVSKGPWVALGQFELKLSSSLSALSVARST